MNSGTRLHAILLGCALAVLAWSAANPYDRFTWWLEVMPALAGGALLCATYSTFRFTNLCYVLIVMHVALLCVGGHYTYARVPLFETARAIFGFHRNHFDRVGHFAQGFVPAMIARELLLRWQIVQRKRWLPFLVVCICLAISATYELVEWWTALAIGAAANDFIGSQGDVWDTQEDMFAASIGAISALLLLSRAHDKALQRISFSK